MRSDHVLVKINFIGQSKHTKHRYVFKNKSSSFITFQQNSSLIFFQTLGKFLFI